MEVKALIDYLLARGVSDFEGYGVKVSFHRPQGQSKTVRIPFEQHKSPLVTPDTKAAAESQIGDQAGMAQQMDGELEYDKVLNWSASPDPNEKETPLTGDAQPLTQQG